MNSDDHTMTIQWHGTDKNDRKILGLNREFIHTALSLAMDDVMWFEDVEPWEQADFYATLADVAWTLAEHNSSDSLVLATQLCDVKVRKKLTRDSISHLTAGIMRLVEQRIQGDGTMLFQATKKNPYRKGTGLHDVYEGIGDGVYWSQALLRGYSHFQLTTLIAAGFVRTAKNAPRQHDAPMKKRLTRRASTRSRMEHRPAP